MRILHLLVNHLSWLKIICPAFRKGIASSMAGCCALVQVRSCFCFLQRWSWTKTSTWHHSSFQVQPNSAVSLIINFRSWCPFLPNHAAALIWLLLGKQDPVSGQRLQKTHEQHWSYSKYSATTAFSWMEKRVLVPPILQTHVLSCYWDSPAPHLLPLLAVSSTIWRMDLSRI